MINTLRRLIQRYGFFKREPLTLADINRQIQEPWETHKFYTEWQRKNERLAQIARERDALKERLAKAIRDKKARAPIYAKLRALSVEELKVESGK